MKLKVTRDLEGDAAAAAAAPSASAPARAKYVLGVDVGSTVIRCHVYDKAAVLRGSSTKQVRGARGRFPSPPSIFHSLRSRRPHVWLVLGSREGAPSFVLWGKTFPLPCAQVPSSISLA